jgi:hypothetical protein
MLGKLLGTFEIQQYDTPSVHINDGLVRPIIM